MKLERCQSWFLRYIFHVPSSVSRLLLLTMSDLASVASEIATRKFLFLGSLITEPNMAPAIRILFESGNKSCFDANVISASVMLSISEVIVRYNLFHDFESLYNNSTFPSYQNWKKIVRDKILAFESETWSQFCEAHLDMRVTQACFENMPPHHFWSLADKYPDLVIRIHTQFRLMGNFGLNGSVS